MVKKLFKHEMRAYLRVIIPVQIILLGVALLSRIIQFFETDSTVYNIINGSSIFAFCAAAMVTLMATHVFAIVRFYRHLFTGEGYLTFTLPVTPTQHLLVKLMTPLLFLLVNVLLSVVATCIVTAGDVLTEVLRAIAFLWNELLITLRENSYHVWLYIAEAVVLLLVAAMASILFFYLCVALGQLFKKNRVLAAVGVYFGFYVVNQILGTIVIIFVTLFSESPLMIRLLEYVQKHPYATIHTCALIVLAVAAVLGVAYFLVTRRVITRRLNLE